jgi:hypothetical protein
MQTHEFTRNPTWSAAEKKVARAAFDAALERERMSARREVEAILARSPDSAEVWSVRDYLNEKAREIDAKYDYRYSVLIDVFGRLVAERWLSISELSGLAREKLQLIEQHAVYWPKRDA